MPVNEIKEKLAEFCESNSHPITISIKNAWKPYKDYYHITLHYAIYNKSITVKKESFKIDKVLHSINKLLDGFNETH
jgi:hypothetical protein